jgi:hypothetical protein
MRCAAARLLFESTVILLDAVAYAKWVLPLRRQPLHVEIAQTEDGLQLPSPNTEAQLHKKAQGRLPQQRTVLGMYTHTPHAD